MTRFSVGFRPRTCLGYSTCAEGRIWPDQLGMRHPRPSLFSSVTCEPTCVRGPYPPEGHHGSKQMRLQVLAIMENGASKIIPKGSDTLRVLLILRAPEGSPASESPESQRGSPPSPIRRRVMRSLVAGS